MPWSGESGVVPHPCLVEAARHVGRHVDEQRIEGLNEPIKRCVADTSMPRSRSSPRPSRHKPREIRPTHSDQEGRPRSIATHPRGVPTPPRGRPRERCRTAPGRAVSNEPRAELEALSSDSTASIPCSQRTSPMTRDRATRGQEGCERRSGDEGHQAPPTATGPVDPEIRGARRSGTRRSRLRRRQATKDVWRRRPWASPTNRRAGQCCSCPDMVRDEAECAEEHL